MFTSLAHICIYIYICIVLAILKTAICLTVAPQNLFQLLLHIIDIYIHRHMK